MRKVLILGGAGFIGSNVCKQFVASGCKVIAVDGLMPRTAGDRANLGFAPDSVELIARRVEDFSGLSRLMRRAALVVDAVGWTSHWEAFDDPEYDLALNLASHLAVIRAMVEARPRLLVYLGSRYQYGRVSKTPIPESQPFAPIDVQGIHKAAAEHHFRLAAERNDLAVASLRFGNTFGPAMPLVGSDVGLVGDMIRSALAGKVVRVFGENRRRTLHYAPDIARIVERLADVELHGFTAINIPGEDVSIADLARHIVRLGGGSVAHEPLPADVAELDMANLPLDCTVFERLLGSPQLSPLNEALAATVAYARVKLESHSEPASTG
jgi:UDP-glucose 4-epimerase